jgi:hypothetical protein
MRGWREGDRQIAADPTDGYFWDLYEVLEFDGEQLKYRNPTTGNTFRVKRVSPSFTLSDSP